MAFNDKTENQGHDNDRLSLLPETILIEILTRLPLKTAVSTEVLSPYWRGLWTQITSINIDILKPKPTFDCIIQKFTSPSIHTLNVKFQTPYDRISINWWLGQIFRRSLRHFRLLVSCVEAPIPSFIFQTHSLLSIELVSRAGWQFPTNIDPINLPNLVMLTLDNVPLKHYDSLEKLIKSCPSLEKLSLTISTSLRSDISIKLSNANLRWLYIVYGTQKDFLSVNAPMLRYLAIRAYRPPTVCFDIVPIGLHEAKLDFCYHSDNKIDLISKFYERISNVTILNICHHALTPVTIYRNVTRLTLTFVSKCDPFTVLSKLVHFPKLNILMLKFGYQFNVGNIRSSLDDGCVSALRQVKRIDIDSDWDFHVNYLRAGKEFFSKLVAHLLRSATVLERFNFNTHTSARGREGDQPILEEREYMFCRLLYHSRRASKECEVSFTGRCLRMSPKTVPNVLKANGEVLPLNKELRRET